jgi:hypothetical protein
MVFISLIQNWQEPILKWFLVVIGISIIISPFLVIRNKAFQPTKWRHIVMAYFASLILFIGVEFAVMAVNSLAKSWWIIGAEQNAWDDILLLIFVLFPLLVFYSTKIIYKKFTLKLFLGSLIGAWLLLMIMIGLFILIMVLELHLLVDII